MAQGEEDMIGRRDDLAGVDDLVAEIALTRRARQRQLADAPNPLCWRRFTHPRWPTQLNSSGYLVVETCACLRLSAHDGGCVCEHNIEPASIASTMMDASITRRARVRKASKDERTAAARKAAR